MGIKTLEYGIKQAKGLYQGMDDNLLSMSYSPDCQNIDVSEGTIKVIKGGQISHAANTVPVVNMTAKRLFSFKSDEVDFGSAFILGESNGTTYKWYSMNAITGVTLPYEIKTSGGASLSTINPSTANSVMTKIDGSTVMIITGHDAYPVKVYYDTNDRKFYYATLQGTPPKGNLITQHRDRIWMSGVVDNLNSVYYSNAYDAEDWSASGETGVITIESFDEDKIVSIANIFDDVVIFKRNSVWRITGDTPSEYAVEKVFSVQGTIYPNSVCTDGDLCFYMGNDGIYKYDGIKTYPIAIDSIKDVLKKMDGNVSCSLLNNKLYVFDRKVTSEYAGKHIIYDVLNKTLSILKAQDIYDAITSEWYRTRIYYTDGSYLYFLESELIDYEYTQFHNTDIVAYWITPENDCGYPNAEKTLDHISFNGWGTTSAGAAGGQVKITIYYNLNGTQRTKEKIVTLSTTRRYHEIQVGVDGRLFKFKIENVSGSAINISSFTPVYEVDEG